MKPILILIFIILVLLLTAGCTSEQSAAVPLPSKTASPTLTPTTIKTIVITSPPTTKATTVPTTASGPVCDCSGDLYNCGDFPLPNGASGQKCFEYCKSIGKGDVHKLDRDKDGFVCEPGWT